MDQVTIENTFYRQDVERVASYFPWEKLKNCNILVTGARGLIGSFLIDVLMTANKKEFTVYGIKKISILYNTISAFHLITLT